MASTLPPPRSSCLRTRAPPPRSRGRAAAVSIVALVIAALGGGAGCATTDSNGGDLNDTCGAVVLAVIAVPCAIAWGTGCVVGGCTACVEHQGEGERADTPPPSSSSAEVAPAAPQAGEEAQRVSY